MQIDYNDIVSKINSILSLLQSELSESGTSKVIHYYEVGEMTLAVDKLIDVIYESKIELDKPVYDHIRKLCLELGLEEDYWKYLKVK